MANVSHVSVVHCEFCGRTGDLVLRAERFWCGWCQDWVSASIEVMEDAIIKTDDGPTSVVRPPKGSWPLQPLRIPEGWTVAYNAGLYEVDPPGINVPEFDLDHIFSCDMLQLKNERRNRLDDLGWTPEGDMEEGAYMLVVYEGDFGGTLLHEYRGTDRAELVAEIERLLITIMRGEL